MLTKDLGCVSKCVMTMLRHPRLNCVSPRRHKLLFIAVLFAHGAFIGLVTCHCVDDASNSAEQNGDRGVITSPLGPTSIYVEQEIRIGRFLSPCVLVGGCVFVTLI